MDSALAVDPTAYYVHRDRAYVLLYAGDAAGARASARLAERVAPLGGTDMSDLDALLVTVQAATGDSAAARAGAERLAHVVAGTAATTVYPASYVASALLSVGERGRCLDVLEGLRPRGAIVWDRLRDPIWDPVRSDPRFVRLFAESRPPGAP